MMSTRAVLSGLVALLAVCRTAAAVAAEAPGSPPLPPPALDAIPVPQIAAAPGQATLQSKAEEQYQLALDIRDMQDATLKELKQAVKLLYAAAGIQHLSLERGNVSSIQQQPEYLTAASVHLVLRNDTVPHQGALKELVYVYREGDGVPINPAIAHRLLLLLAELGNPEATADVGFHAALGVEPVAPNSLDQLFRLVPPDVPSALVHYMFAARAGDPVAQMSLGYRHLQGINVPRSCQSAAMYYAPVADKVLQMAQIQEGLPQINSLRLSYKTAHTWQPSNEQEVLHYQWFADFGNVDAARTVAHMLSHGAARDYEQAIRYLLQAAAAGDAGAMAHLGHIYANGVGVPQDNAAAMSWFWKAADQDHASGYFGLGYMHMQGHGTQRDYVKALHYFLNASKAAEVNEWAGRGDIYFYMGLMHLRGLGVKPNVTKAVQMWYEASLVDHLLASYNLAQLHLGGHTRAHSPCQEAVTLLKKVAEKGFPTLQEANDDFQAGDYEWSLLNYLKAAEMGQELGQSNAAWMLTEGYGYEGPEAGATALQLYKRAAAQGNHDALLRIGDGYWYGKGVPRDWPRAAQMYNEAGKHHNAQALFNMGFIHQFGVGLPKDFHLAKRFYDRSLVEQPDASLAVHMALGVLRLHTWWEGMEGNVPGAWAGLVSRLFALIERSATGAAAAQHAQQHHASPVKHGAWVRLRAVLSLDSLFDALDNLFELGDNLDLTVAVGLLLMLALVLWRRRMLRNQHLVRQFVQAQLPGAAAPAVPRWAQPVPQQGQQPAPQPDAGALVAAAAPEGAVAAGGSGSAGGSGTNGSQARVPTNELRQGAEAQQEAL